MHGIQRLIVLLAIGNMAIYMPYFFIQFLRNSPTINVPWHFAGMLLNLLAFVATIRDLYQRPFPNPNSKVTWCLLILCTGGIGLIVYVFKHALRPRIKTHGQNDA